MSDLATLLQEKAKRQVPDLLSACFPQQKEFILHPSRRKAALVARRSGKSYMIGIYLLYVALTFPKVKCLYFAKTQYAAKNVMWLHIIQELCTKFNIKYTYHKTLQEITFDNKSIIKLCGDDATDKQIENALGGKYKLVIFDECQVITHDLERWVKYRLGPAMVDQQGTICMTGTTGDYMAQHFWYKVTKTDGPREPGWQVNTWQWQDNPYMKELLAQEIAQLKKDTPNIEITPGFRQEYLCEWVVETEGRIYKYNAAINAIQDPKITESLLNIDRKWIYLLGIDPGFEDATAFTICAYSRHDKNFYIVESFKKTKLHAIAMADEIVELKKKYPFSHMIVDGANKQVVEACRQVFRLPLIAANKKGKVAHWGLMNADFLTSRIKVNEAKCQGLIKEWSELIYNEKKRIVGVLEENPTKDNHEADACLYAWFYSRHYRATPEPEPFSTAELRMQEAEKRYKKAFQLADNPIDLLDQQDVQDFVQLYKNGIH